MSEKVTSEQLRRRGLVYVRQSTSHQVLHNEESRRLQYAMKERLHSLGWQTVEVIDDDLGHSAATAGRREGFKRLVAEVCLGEVGAVAAREVSRFARNSREWHQLIDMCSLVGTVLVDHDAIYNPRSPNDRLLLGLKGSLSEYELDLLRQRSLGARRAKAARGELVITVPVGFRKTFDQRIEKDPDRRIQRAVELVFDKLFELGSARQVLMWLHEHGMEFPHRRYGPEGWETWWKTPTYPSVIRILRDPTYAGAYAYGRTATTLQVKEGVLEKKRSPKPRDEWDVLIQKHHDGYIPWERFEKVQEMLEKNTRGFAGSRPGAPKKGLALLAGLLRCRRCGLKLVVSYSGNNRTVPRYCCRRGFLDCREAKCISFGGLPVDEGVVREVLRVVQPCAIDAATTAANELNSKRDDALDALLLELKAARYAADRAWRQYDAIDPANRLVADELERRWNVALERVSELERKVDREHAAQQQRGLPVTADSLAELAANLERVWDCPATDVRLKKRIIRTVIEEIVVDVDAQASEVALVVHWKGGVHTELRVPRRRRGHGAAHTSAEVIYAIRVLALVCRDRTIAGYLNRNGILTARGNRWTSGHVTTLRNKHQIPVCNQEQRLAEGWMKLTEAAAHVGISAIVVRQAVERGKLPGLHPLSDGPWVLKRHDLDEAETRGLFGSANSTPGKRNDRQLNLTIPET